MTDSAVYPIPASFSDAHITPESYRTLYAQSLEDPDTFWSQQAELLDWHTRWSAISETDIDTGAARNSTFLSIVLIGTCPSALMISHSYGREITPKKTSPLPFRI